MKRLLKFRNLLWLAIIPVGFFALRLLPWNEIYQSLRQLTVTEIIILTGLNTIIVILFSCRWWLILLAYRYTIPYLKLVGYRMAGFSISYFTPGTQFGGEPLQVYLVQTQHQVPAPIAIAAVTLDKLIELLANFTFLTIGILVTVSSGVIPGLTNPRISLWIGLLLAVPLVYLGSLWSKRYPITSLIDHLPDRLWSYRWLKPIPDLVKQAEIQISILFHQNPWIVFWMLFISGLVWSLIVIEYWLMGYFLGARMNFFQAIAGLTATRIAFLTPLPGGVGVLEASQVLAMRAFGFSGALGITISLLIRVRDLTLGFAGLAWGAALTRQGIQISLKPSQIAAVTGEQKSTFLID